MTQPRSTLMLVLAAAALLAYILLFERHRPDTVQQRELARRLFPELNPALVTRVSILSTNGSVQAERQGNRWRLVDPSYPARGQQIDEWLDSVSQLVRRARISAEELSGPKVNLALLGLDPPRTSVAIEQGTQKFQFRLGVRAPLGERVYLQVVGASDVDTTDGQPFQRMPQRPADWRDPALVSLSEIRFDRLHLRTPTREYEVQRDSTQGAWRLVRPRPARADTARIEQMLAELQTVQVTRFVEDFPTADLEPYGLQAPEVTLAFREGTNAALILELGRSPTNAVGQVYARRSTLPGIVLVPRQVLDLVAVPYTQLLDYQLLDFPVESVQRVEVRADEEFALRRQPAGVWRAEQAPDMPVDPALMQEFLKRLRALRMTEVAKELVTDLDLPNYGLAQPIRQYTVQWPGGAGATNPASLRLDFGTNRQELVYARRADESAVYLVRLADALELPRAKYNLRDRRIWSFTTNQVRAVSITSRGSTWRLLRSPVGEWGFAPGSHGIIPNTFALEEAVYQLGQLRARFWQDQGTNSLERYGLASPVSRLAIEFVRNDQTETVTLDTGAASPSGGPYALVTLEGVPTVFEMPADVYLPYSVVLGSMGLSGRDSP